MKNYRCQNKSFLITAVILIGLMMAMSSCTSRQGCPGLITKGQIQNTVHS